jgi:protein-tyrosine kinase
MSIVERALAKANAQGRGNSSDARKTDSGVPPQVAERHPGDAPYGANNAVIDIDSKTLRLTSLVPPVDMEQRLSEEMRVIKRPLLLNAEDGNATVPKGNIVMVGSALPGAGKTFTSFNLALSMASELDWTVLLIDADVSRPALSRGLGVDEAAGLMGMLEKDGANLSDYVFRTSHPRLLFLPAGRSRAEAGELLGSQRMRSFIADVADSRHRRIVIIDSSPLLLTSEARVLASHVGQVVLVVEAGKTPRRSLLDAIELLDQTKAINLVLNKSRRVFGIGDYHYYTDYFPSGRQAAD